MKQAPLQFESKPQMVTQSFSMLQEDLDMLKAIAKQHDQKMSVIIRALIQREAANLKKGK